VQVLLVVVLGVVEGRRVDDLGGDRPVPGGGQARREAARAASAAARCAASNT
jgi:hypothetical protein